MYVSPETFAGGAVGEAPVVPDPCQEAIRAFFANYLPAGTTREYDDTPREAGVGVVAEDWLRSSRGTPAQDEQTAEALLALIGSVPTDRLQEAVQALMFVRARFGPKSRAGEDVTYGLVARIQGRVAVTRVDAPDSLNTRLTDTHFEVVRRLADRHRRVASSVPRLITP